MKKLLTIYAAALALAFASCEAPRMSRIDQVNIVPKPTLAVVAEGVFDLTKGTPVNLLTDDAEAHYAVNLFNELVSPSLGKALKPVRTEVAADGAVNIELDPALGPEAYTLSITPARMTVTAGSAAGAFYAFQTLRQLLPDAALRGEQAGVIELPAVSITDEPFFAYRGTLLDVGRHFFTAQEVKDYLDLMAIHKINRLQWHLTDDQGWRIEIKQYPKLTEIGSVRASTQNNQAEFLKLPVTMDGVPSGGFYTQDEIRDVVQYAAERFITVIPEIEMPGHATAALASYPELGCLGEGYEVSGVWGVHKEVFCAGKESTFEFLENVLAEVIGLFPSTYIHLGGDECPKERWEACPLCQARMKEEGLKDEFELQSYFMRRMEKFAQSHGRQIIGWDEILEGGLSPTATVLSWRGSKGGIEAAKQGNNAIMCPQEYCYFDYYQTEDWQNEPYIGWGSCIPVEKAYRLDPLEGLDADEQKFILGPQANLWGEYIAQVPHLQYMTLPRLAALAEVGWTYGPKDWDDFKARVTAFKRLYDAKGYVYAPHMFED